MNTRIILLSACAFALAAPLGAQTTPFTTADAITRDTSDDYFDFGLSSSNVFRGIKRAGSNSEAGFRVNRGFFYAGALTMVPYENHTLAEYDYTAGLHGPIPNATSAQSLSYDAGVAVYDYPGGNRPAIRLRDTYEARVGLTATLAPEFTASAYAYYDFRLEAKTYEGATSYTVPIPDAHTSIILRAFAGYTEAKAFQRYADYRGYDSYSYYGFSGEMPWRINNRVTLVGLARYGDNINLHGGTRVYDTTDTWSLTARMHYKF